MRWSSSYALGVGALLLATVGASGCSSGEAKQDFAVPASLYGVSVPFKALSRTVLIGHAGVDHAGLVGSAHPGS
ncbi:hypothetical protein [Streptomyces sp. NPDC059575]|uniref:hypothetical protein n=1 Tax=Streptomyces sp. NPDC059575 TaxID=3346872 RepID=UPI0036CF5A92